MQFFVIVGYLFRTSFFIHTKLKIATENVKIVWNDSKYLSHLLAHANAPNCTWIQKKSRLFFFIPLIMLYVWVFFAYHHHRHHHCQLFMQRWWWSLTKFLQILIFDLSSHQFSIIHFIQNAYVCIELCMCITRNFWITWQWNFIIGHDGERLKISIHETWILFILKRSVCVCTISYVRGSIWSEKKLGK